MSEKVTFHHSTFPDTIRRKVAEGISRRRLPPSLLYESIGQTSRWLKYAKAWSPIHRNDEVHLLYQTVYRSVLEGRSNDEFQYVALGCGDGLKDTTFLELADSLHKRSKVSLIDVSPSLTLGASQRLSAWQPQLHVADLESEPRLSDLEEALTEQEAVISCLGMLPTLGHQMLLPYLVSILKQDDRLILSANLSPSESVKDKAAILSQYDNSEALQWYTGALLELGLERNDFSLECAVKSFENNSGVYHLVTYAKINQNLTISVYGDAFPIKEGERIEVFRSERWIPSELRAHFNGLGLELISGHESTDNHEGVYELAKRKEHPSDYL